jgi:hypothetical protein
MTKTFTDARVRFRLFSSGQRCMGGRRNCWVSPQRTRICVPPCTTGRAWPLRRRSTPSEKRHCAVPWNRDLRIGSGDIRSEFRH